MIMKVLNIHPLDLYPILKWEEEEEEEEEKLGKQLAKVNMPKKDKIYLKI